MCRDATVHPWGCALAVVVAALGLGVPGWAQTVPRLHLDWRQIGNWALEMSLASPASGPVDRVWFSEDGSVIFIKTRSGRILATADQEKWNAGGGGPVPEPPEPAATSVPEPGSRLRAANGNPARLYAMAGQMYRSDDGGASWSNLTAYRSDSIIGGGMRDFAVSPRNPDEVVVANDFGVWRSVDGGLTWSGLNDALPNLAVRRLLSAPQGSRGVRILVEGLGAFEWAPGEKQAWRPVSDRQAAQEAALRRALSTFFGVEITAAVSAGDFVYAGAADGRLWASPDRGRTWRSEDRFGGPVESLFVDPEEPLLALAALGAAPGGSRTQVLRTTNGGLFWDDLTANLPDGAAHGVTADRASGSVYVATDRGVFFTRADLNAPAPATDWTPLSEGLPDAPARDVRLDANGNQLFVALEGYGVYATMAPHRLRNVRLVSAADLSHRPAAPGSLYSVLGARINTARAGDLSVPVLAAGDHESQIQIPFEVRGSVISLALATPQANLTLGLPLETVSPAIFVDRDGTPLLLNADTGVLLDAMNPARSNSRVQILATGLGRVSPAWPTGLPAPIEDPPKVIAPVRVYLDRTPVEVTRATLAPGYIGFYLIEVQLPEIVNAGPAELYLESEGRSSNRVRLYLEP